MASYDIISIGGAVQATTFYTTTGKVIDTPHNLTAQRMLAFEYGAKINSTDVHFSFGGGAANVATTCSRMGLKTGIITRIGKDQIGGAILQEFRANNVATALVQQDPKLFTGFSFIVTTDKKEKEHVAFMSRGANDALHISLNELATEKASWFYITSLSGKNWLPTLKTIFAVAAKRNIKVAWNPGTLQLQAGKRILAPFLQKTHTLLLNKDEAIELVLSGITLGKKNPAHLSRPLYLINLLAEWGPKVILVTEGHKGAWAGDGAHVYHQSATRGKVADTTGVGDAFGSAFVSSLWHGNGLPEALKWGALNSGAAIAKIGAQEGLLTLRTLKEKL